LGRGKYDPIGFQATRVSSATINRNHVYARAPTFFDWYQLHYGAIEVHLPFDPVKQVINQASIAFGPRD